MADLKKTSCATQGVAVTPNDSTALEATRALYVGTGGDVAVVFLDGGAATLVAVPAGAVLPISVTKVKSTGTTADDIVALY